MDETLKFLQFRIVAMQTRIETLEKIISELNGQFLVDRNIDVKQLRKFN